MSYSDIINATKLYGNLLNQNLSNKANNLANIQMDYAPVNPYSSGAYTPRSSRNIYTGEGRDVINPVTAMEEQLTGTEDLLSKGSSALQYGGIAKTISPYLQKLGTKLGASGTLGNLGPAAMLYGATRNQNPYDWTPMEGLGTIGSTLLGAQSLAPLLGLTSMAPVATAAASPLLTPLVSSAGAGAGASIMGMHPGLFFGSLLLGHLFSKKGRKKAKKMREEAYADIEEKQQDVFKKRQEQVEESREDFTSQWMAEQHRQKQDQYDNQYGGHYIDRSYADQGMKMKGDIIAEFTGNELVVNDQDKIENALAKKNYSRVASYIKKAMDKGQVTPGPETHQGNPMPVDSEGNIYAGGGMLPFKAKKGAGIYDHATDQFKKGMTDKEIAMVVQNNINKWKSNGMA